VERIGRRSRRIHIIPAKSGRSDSYDSYSYKDSDRKDSRVGVALKRHGWRGGGGTFSPAASSMAASPKAFPTHRVETGGLTYRMRS